MFVHEALNKREHTELEWTRGKCRENDDDDEEEENGIFVNCIAVPVAGRERWWFSVTLSSMWMRLLTNNEQRFRINRFRWQNAWEYFAPLCDSLSCCCCCVDQSRPNQTTLEEEESDVPRLTQEEKKINRCTAKYSNLWRWQHPK